MKTNLTDEHAFEFGSLLGYIDEVAQKKGKRFYSYLKGEVKNQNYDEYIHWGNIPKRLLPALSFLIKNNYSVPNLDVVTSEITKQRDELLEACKSALEVSNSMGNKYPYDVSIQLTNAIFNATVK